MISSKSKKAIAPIAIDYPAEKDQIVHGHYAIRVSSAGNEAVEISIDGGPWDVCRFASGYFWYDWWPEKTGKHEIEVRLAGNPKKTVARACRVAAPNNN